MNEECYKNWDLIIKILGLIISSIIILLVIFGEKIKRRFYMPKLKILFKDINDFDYNIKEDSPIIRYYLTIKNEKPSNIAKNCQILLEKIERYNENQDKKFDILPFPLPFIWEPKNLTNVIVDIKDNEIIHFGSINDITDSRINLRLILYSDRPIIDQSIIAKERIRFYLKIKSENFDSRKYYIFEITWNGEYNSDVNIMKNNIKIIQIQ